MEAAPEPVVYTDDEMELDEELEAVARYEECRMVLGMSARVMLHRGEMFSPQWSRGLGLGG